MILRCAGFLAGAFLVFSAEARIYNYQDVPVGERSFGMGQVSMALSGDVGNAYFNPAVLSWSKGTQMAASVSAYERIDSRTGKFVSIFESALDNVKRGGFESVPSMIGGHLQKGDWTWGGAAFVPTSFSSAGTQDSNDKFFSYEGVNQDVWLNIFGTFKKTENHRFGISLFYISKELREKFVTADQSAADIETRFEERFWSVNGFSFIVGGVHVLSDAWKVGWSFRAPVWKWGGEGQVSEIETLTDTSRDQEFSPQLFPLPMRFSAGASYEFSDDLILAWDVHFYPGFKGNMRSGGEEEFEIDAKPIANVGIGAEYWWSKGLGFRIGINTNLSAARQVPEGMSAVVDKIHMGTGTSAIVMRTENGNISIGGWISGGQGYSKNFDPDNLKTVPRSLYLYGAVVASTYKF
jgi:hypothetical protein